MAAETILLYAARHNAGPIVHACMESDGPAARDHVARPNGCLSFDAVTRGVNVPISLARGLRIAVGGLEHPETKQMADGQPVRADLNGMIVCAADSHLADGICGLLADKGLALVPIDQLVADSSLGVVVLMSPGALLEPTWLAQVEKFQASRLVPVKLGDLPDELVPKILRPLNWIVWRDDQRDLMAVKLFTALQSDMRRHRITRGLASMADAWQRGGRQEEDLVLDVREARKAKEILRRQAAVDPAATRPELLAFVEQSVKRSRRQRRWRRFRWARRYSLAAVVAILAVYVVITSRQLVAANKLEFSVGDLQAANRPDLQAIKLSGELVNGLSSQSAHPVAFRQLVGKLSQPWTSAMIGVATDSAVNDVTLVSDHRRAITVDGRGAVSWWDTRTGNVVHRYGYGAGPLYTITATDSGDMIAVANDRKVIVLDGEGRRVHTYDADAAGGIALTGDGRSLVIVTAAGTIRTIGVGSAAPAHDLDTPGTVLALRRVADGRVLAVLDRGSQLTLVDAVNGQTLARTAWLRPTYPIAAIGADASVVVNEGDGQLWWARSDLRLSPTGQHVPDILTALAIATDQSIIVASDTYGASIFDPTDGLVLGPVCTEFSRVLGVRTSPDGMTISCNGRGLVDLVDLNGRTPIGRPTPHADKPYPLRATSAVGPISSVSAAVDGIVAITLRSGRTIALDPAATLFSKTSAPAQSAVLAPGKLYYSGLATSVAIRPDGGTLAVGSSDAVVTEIDVLASGAYSDVGRWQLPDGSAVRGLAWDGAGHLDADSDMFRWQERSCAGCFGDVSKVFNAVAQRHWACYAAETVDVVPAQVQRLLDLQVCAIEPEPEGR